MNRILSIRLCWLVVAAAAVCSGRETSAAGRRQGEPLQWNAAQPAPLSSGAVPYQSAVPAQDAVRGQGGNLPGGPYGQVGTPYYYTPQTYDPAANFSGADPYTLHFGQGYYRNAEYGHHRFPYYSYRRPWYFPGHTSYNRDTNYPW